MKMTEDLKLALEPSTAERLRAMPDDELLEAGRRELIALGHPEAATMSKQEIGRLARKMLKEDGVVTPP